MSRRKRRNKKPMIDSKMEVEKILSQEKWKIGMGNLLDMWKSQSLNGRDA